MQQNTNVNTDDGQQRLTFQYGAQGMFEDHPHCTQQNEYTRYS